VALTGCSLPAVLADTPVWRSVIEPHGCNSSPVWINPVDNPIESRPGSGA
jgi:hypothetical protein